MREEALPKRGHGGHPLKRALVRLVVRSLLLGLAGLRWIAALRPPRPAKTRDLDILLTGTFHSNNWVSSHLLPLAGASRCRRLRVVTLFDVPPIDKVEVVRPPQWLQRLVGGVPARLATFVFEAFRGKPDWVGGFHLLINGLLAGVVARWVGARSLYFCVGGPAEVLNGGIGGENRLFSELEVADPVTERLLERAVDDFDLVITMGKGARAFFAERTRAKRIRVHSGGIDGRRFHPRPPGPAQTDLIFVGRLAPIKRVDLLLRVVALAVAKRPATTATIVGDGALRSTLEALATELGLVGSVRFLGLRSDVEDLLREANVFMLTSQSEGLSLSVIEAMMSGVPAIVPAVGDLAELVDDGANGFVVKGDRAEDFATPLLALLESPERLRSFREAALRSAERHELAGSMGRWDSILGPDNEATELG
jgi:glycosyltransferase involved in cell wall biosynthesis